MPRTSASTRLAVIVSARTTTENSTAHIGIVKATITADEVSVSN